MLAAQVTSEHIPKQSQLTTSNSSETAYFYPPPGNLNRRSVSPSAEKTVADAMLSLSAQTPDLEGPVNMYGVNEYPHQQQTQHIVVTPDTAGHLPISPASQRQHRKDREFIPEGRKDETYWSKRRKNNEAAKRSREKRRMNDMAMAQKIIDLTNENTRLKQEVAALKRGIGYPIDKVFVAEEDGEKSSAVQLPPAVQPQQMLPQLGREAMSEQQHQEMEGQQTQPMAQAVAIPVPYTAMPVLIAAQQRMLSPKTLHDVQAFSSATSTNTSASFSPVSSSSITSISTSQQPPVYNDQPVGTGTYVIEPVSPAEGNSRCNSPDSRSESPHSLKISLSADSSDSEMSDAEKPEQSTTEGQAPLNLSTRQMDEGYSTNDSSSTSDVGCEDKNREYSSIPHKLRHKMNNTDSYSKLTHQLATYPTSVLPAAMVPGMSSPSPPQQQHQHQQHHFIPQQPLEESYLSEETCHLNPESKYDFKYIERRRRNNLAARKCRENRKAVSDLRLAKSEVLEDENSRLKGEIQTLSSEISSLRNLLEQKKEAQAKGEPFTPPPVEEFTELAD